MRKKIAFVILGCLMAAQITAQEKQAVLLGGKLSPEAGRVGDHEVGPIPLHIPCEHVVHERRRLERADAHLGG